MATKIAPVFKAKDDSEWQTAKQAEARNAVVVAENKFKEAVEEVSRRMKEAALTADGEPFACDRGSSNFWWLCPAYGGRLPMLRRVYVYPYHASIDHDYQKNGRLVVREYCGERREYVTYPVNELYVDQKKAQAAHLAACEERLKEIATEVETLRTEYAK